MDVEKIRENLKGCSNHGCIVKEPVGMGTNGMCQCSSDRYKMERLVYVLKHDLKKAQDALGERAQ